ncbi:MAG TPA: tripartite tricarboxylate transporter TctB family protein [Candidatus Glassbacteria bacterium]|nr:tripartite tricarboxylate transporter TctB family protein [Candidatus Glassbacteria bacterium]
MMRNHDRWVAVFLMVVGLAAAADATPLRLGTPGRPGPGFFPFCLGLALCIVSLGLLRNSWRASAPPPTGKLVSKELAGGDRKIVWVTLALLGYAFTLEPLGFALATFLLLLFLNQVVKPRRWPAAIGASALITLLAYGLFHVLRVQLPAGAWIG